MDDQISEATRRGTSEVRHGYGRGVPPLTAHPTVLGDRGHRAPSAASRSSADDGTDGTDGPLFAAPGLILVAALAIFEGYHWLHLFPGGIVRPTSLLFVLAVAPATFALTRHLRTPRWPWARVVARVTAPIVVVLGLVATFDHDTPLNRVLGLACLVLAASIVSLVVASERRRPPPVRTD